MTLSKDAMTKHTSSDEPDISQQVEKILTKYGHYHDLMLDDIIHLIHEREQPQGLDELEKVLIESDSGNYGDWSSWEVQAYVSVLKKKLEAYIKTHYIKKADVVEAIGEDEPEDTDLGDGRTSVDNQKRGANKLRSKLLESLNLEGEK